jgi:hypothetical protein
MYLLLLATLLAIFISSYILTNLFFNNRGSALLLIISILLYFFPMLAGLLGILRLFSLFSLALITLFIVMIVYLCKLKSFNQPIGFNQIRIEYCARPMIYEMLLVVIPAISSLAWILIFAVQSARHKIALIYIPPFPWDVVEYHFPHLVDALQSGSLWTTVWAHYPMGGEMFHAWGFSFLRSDALVYPTHFFFSILLIFFSCLVLKVLCFPGSKLTSGTEVTVYLILTVMLLLFPPLWDMHFNQIGKNDSAMSALIVAVLYFFLQCLTEPSNKEIFRQNLLLAGIALGIASGIKPTGVLYSLFFLGMLLKESFSKRVPWYPVVVLGSCILLLAVFWYIRPLIMLGTIPPAGVDQSVAYNLKKGLALFIHGRENILFSLSMVFCLIMGVVWHKKDFKIRVAIYTLAASIVIFCVTPFSAFNRTDMQLRLSPAMIPLVIIIAMATFLRLLVKISENNKTYPMDEPNAWTYRRKTILASVLLSLSVVAMVAISFMSGFETKPRLAWFLRGLIVIGFTATSLYIYNSSNAIKTYTLNIARNFLYVTAFFLVVIILFIQIITYKPSGDLAGYNEQTSAYRWVYKNIQGKTIYDFGLRPYGLYGKDLANRVIYGGYSSDMKLEYLVPVLKQEKPGFLVIGRDFAQHQGWYDFSPFPADVAKILAWPNIFKLLWSDDHAMIFKIDPSFYSSSAPTTGRPE